MQIVKKIGNVLEMIKRYIVELLYIFEYLLVTDMFV